MRGAALVGPARASRASTQDAWKIQSGARSSCGGRRARATRQSRNALAPSHDDNNRVRGLKDDAMTKVELGQGLL